MAKELLASIIIDNYNYDKFIAEAIDSALEQTYPNIEIIVVDDGSTDNSRQIIERYSDKIIKVYKSNGGQASAFNAGFKKSSGDVIFFLDSDDILFPYAVENAMSIYENEENISKVHWQLTVVDEDGTATGVIKPMMGDLQEGNLRELVLNGGPTSCTSSPTSGNAWARDFLEKVMPVPEDVRYYKTCADEYLYTLAPVFGEIRAINDSQGFYRIHGKNIYSALSFRDKLNMELDGHKQQTEALSATLERHGINIDKEKWYKNSWFHRVIKTADDVAVAVPSGKAFIVVDNGSFPDEIFTANKVHAFVERNGKFWGRPEDDAVALRELRRLRAAGASYLVFTWPCFWWLEHYSSFNQYLNKYFTCILKNDELIIFDIGIDLNDQKPFVSIIINNYNYSQFVSNAIDSALAQTYPDFEVIVVDDGSTDNSVEIIKSYGNHIVPVFKNNGGQASAYNVGFANSYGNLICMLDSDDTLENDALEKAVSLFQNTDLVKVQWPMSVIDISGKRTGEITTKWTPPDGDLKEMVLSDGPFYDFHLHTGNLFKRDFIGEVFPMPEEAYRISADEYLTVLAPIYGSIQNVSKSLSNYRIHGTNNYAGNELTEERLKKYKRLFEQNCDMLEKFAEKFGFEVNPELWKEKNFNYIWPDRLLKARDDINEWIPSDQKFILVDQNEWGNFNSRPNGAAMPFTEKDGSYNGLPSSDDDAISEVEKLKTQGAGFIVFWWTAFWLLDHYPAFSNYLKTNYSCILSNERLMIFDLNIPATKIHFMEKENVSL